MGKFSVMGMFRGWFSVVETEYTVYTV